jgi:hypothetical protein
LPIATTAPPTRAPQRSRAAAERVLPIRAASAGTVGSPSAQITGLSVGSRVRVIPSATMRASQKIGAPAASASRAACAAPGVKAMSAAASTIPQAWMIRTATRSSSGEKRSSAASRRMVSNERR